MSTKVAKTRHVKEDVYMPSALGAIRRYINKPYHYIHFSDTVQPWNQKGQKPADRKMLWGLYLQSSFDTPIGIYGFPINDDSVKDLETPSAGYGNKVLKFRADAPAIMIFKAKNPESVLNVAEYTEDDLKQDVVAIKELLKPYAKASRDQIIGKKEQLQTFYNQYEIKYNELNTEIFKLNEELKRHESMATDANRLAYIETKGELTKKKLELDKLAVAKSEVSDKLNAFSEYVLSSDELLDQTIDKTVDDLYERSVRARRVSKPASGLFYVIRFLHENTTELGIQIGNKFLFRRILSTLGYSGVHDPGSGVIHGNEPAQGVYFGTGNIDVLDIVRNPKKETIKWEGKTYESSVAGELKDLLTKATTPIDLGKYTKTKAEELVKIITEDASDAERFFIVKKMLGRDLGVFVDDPNEQVRAEVAKRAPMDIILAMAKDTSMQVKEELIKRYEGKELSKMIKDHILSPSMISGAIENPATTDKYKKVLQDQYKKVIARSISKEAWDLAKQHKFDKLKEEILEKATDSTIVAYINGIFKVLGNPEKGTYSGDVYHINIMLQIFGKKFPQALYNFPNRIIRMAVAQVIFGDTNYAKKMIHDPEVDVRVSLARYGGEEVANLLLKDDEFAVLRHVVAKASPERLAEIMNHSDERIRNAVAARIDTKYLIQMFKDGPDSIRSTILNRDEIPEELYKMAIFMEDVKSDAVRKLALSGMSPPEIEAIALDESLSDDIRTIALSVYQGKLYGQEDVLAKIIEKLVHDNSKTIRMWLAQNAIISYEQIKKITDLLLDDPDLDVVAQYTKKDRYRVFSEEQLKKLLNKKSPVIDEAISQLYSEVPWTLLMNSISAEVRYKAVNHLDAKYLPQMMNDESAKVRQSVAERIGVEHLSQMIKDPDSNIRAVVANRIDAKHLIRLITDPGAQVRAKVANRIPFKYVEAMVRVEERRGNTLSDDDEEYWHDIALESLKSRLRQVRRLKSSDVVEQNSAARNMNLEDLEANFDSIMQMSAQNKISAMRRLKPLMALYFLRNKDGEVRAAAVRTGFSDKHIAKKYYKVIKELVQNDPEALVKLAFIDHAKAEDIYQFVNDPDKNVANKTILKLVSSPMVEGPEGDRNKQFREKLLDRDDLPQGVRTILYQNSSQAFLDDNIKKIISKDDTKATTIVAQKVSPQMLPMFINSAGWKNDNLREFVSRKIEPKYLPLMINDKHYEVREIAADRIPLDYLPKMLGNEILMFNQDYDVLGSIRSRMNDVEYDKLYNRYQTIKSRVEKGKGKIQKSKTLQNTDDECEDCGCECPFCPCEKKECGNCNCGFNNCARCDCHCEDCPCDERECPECNCGEDPCPECECPCADCPCETEKCPECKCGYDDCSTCDCHCEDCPCDEEQCPNCECGYDDCSTCDCHCEDCPCETEKCPNCECGYDDCDECSCHCEDCPCESKKCTECDCGPDDNTATDGKVKKKVKKACAHKHITKESKTRAQKEQIEMPRSLGVLREYHGKPHHYIHFTNTMSVWENKQPVWGLYINSPFDTPLGIYGYPLVDDVMWRVENEQIWFRGEAKAIVIFKARSPHTVLELGTYTDIDLEEDLNKLIDLLPNQEMMIQQLYDTKNKARVNHPGSQLFYIVMHLAGNKFVFNTLFRKLGYSGVNDPGLGIIHQNEPLQAFFLGTQDVDVMDVVKNPQHEKYVPPAKAEVMEETGQPVDMKEYSKTNSVLAKLEHPENLSTAEKVLIANNAHPNHLGNLMSDPSTKVRKAVAKRIPIKLLHMMSTDKEVPEVLEEVVRRSDFAHAKKYLRKFFKDKGEVTSSSMWYFPRLFEAALRNPNIPQDYKARLSAKLEKVVDTTVKKALTPARRQGTYEQSEFFLLSAYNGSDFLRTAMEYLNSTVDKNEDRKNVLNRFSDYVSSKAQPGVFKSLINTQDPFLRIMAINHADPHDLLPLLGEKDPSVAVAVAKNVGAKYVIRMKDNTNDDVRLVVAQRAPVDQLHDLAKDPSLRIRREVMGRYMLNESYASAGGKYTMLDTMYDDPNEDIRKQVASYTKKPERMMNDESPRVRGRIIRKLDKNLLPQMAQTETDPSNLINIIERLPDLETFPKEKLVQLMNNDNVDIRMGVVPAMPPEYLPSMMFDKDKKVRIRVAKLIDSKYLSKMLENETSPLLRSFIRRRMLGKALPNVRYEQL